MSVEVAAPSSTPSPKPITRFFMGSLYQLASSVRGASRAVLSLTRATRERQYARREGRRVSTDPPPRGTSTVRGDGVPRCVHGLPRTTCVFCSPSYWTAMRSWAVLLVVFWFALGPDHPVYPLMVTAWTWVLGPGVAGPVMQRLPRRWFRVPAGERGLHRVLGVGIFGWLLDRSGWNRHLAEPMRGFNGRRSGLLALEGSVRGGTSAHGTCFAIHVLLAAVALFTGQPQGALWMLLQ